MEIKHAHGTGYTINLKDGKRGGYLAGNVAEIVLAVEHYYCGGDKGHMAQSNPACPLCKAQGQFASPATAR